MIDTEGRYNHKFIASDVKEKSPMIMIMIWKRSLEYVAVTSPQDDEEDEDGDDEGRNTVPANST